MTYVDGFVAAVPTQNKDIYKKHAEETAVVFKNTAPLNWWSVGAMMCRRAKSPLFLWLSSAILMKQ